MDRQKEITLDSDSSDSESDESSDEGSDNLISNTPMMEHQVQGLSALQCGHSVRPNHAFERTEGPLLYPNPNLLHSKAPASDMRRKSYAWIAANSKVNSADLFSQTNKFLKGIDGYTLLLSEIDVFDLFRKVTLVHADNPGGAVFGTVKEVIRASPPRDAKRKRRVQGPKQDTALMLDQPELLGIHRK